MKTYTVTFRVSYKGEVDYVAEKIIAEGEASFRKKIEELTGDIGGGCRVELLNVDRVEEYHPEECSEI